MSLHVHWPSFRSNSKRLPLVYKQSVKLRVLVSIIVRIVDILEMLFNLFKLKYLMQYNIATVEEGCMDNC